MQNIVHLDLKGAPLKLPFFEKVILCIKDWGAAGIVLEWEDTFPYWGELSEFGSLGVGSGDNMYTLQEVKHILHFIKQNGMEPIQLIQTIGHLEFVLKHPSYQELREQPSSPAVLCPSKQASLDLVRLMVMQVLDVQPVAEYFHIGADEVWHTGVCADCQLRAAASPHGTASLYLSHVSSLSRFLKQRRPSLNIMMWDDMLRSVSAEAMTYYQLGELVEPVVWDYSMQEHFRIDPEIWGNYKQVFPKIWAGSAYKGANGSAQMVSPVERYVSNQVAWLNEARSLREERGLNICGVLLTGWSRYTHYATLCELLPASLPSLYSCLQTLRLTFRRGRIAVNEAVMTESLHDREWPGREVAGAIHTVANLTKQSRDFMDNEVKTWLNPWQIEKGFTNPLQLESIARNARLFTAAITQLQLPSLLRSVTGARSADEWVATNVTPTLTQLDRVYADACFRATKGASVMPAIDNMRPDKYED